MALAVPQASRSSQRTKKAKSDESIILTNNSSIVSKRSVERLYYPQEPQLFRHFVKKPQRRSPLINRGYWLRMKAIDHVVRGFLNEPSEKKKVVINLGCGYDPLPFQYLMKYPQACQNVTFIDVDYRQLMVKKAEVIWQTAELHELLINASRHHDKDVLLTSNQYLAVGCDLRDVQMLDSILAKELDTTNSMILCTAEVSITYMEVDAADAVIGWASKFDNVRFCLLEQFLPAGADHPFARTMTKHFDKLQTPLKSIQKYKGLSNQQDRFQHAGWPLPFVQSLWELWSNPSFIVPEERTSLDGIEPFDEWEEFALFASHYFLLVAAKSSLCIEDRPEFPLAIQESLDVDKVLIASIVTRGDKSTNSPIDNRSRRQETVIQAVAQPPEAFTSSSCRVRYEANPKGLGCRRFAAAMIVGTRAIGHHGGLGAQTRLSSTDVYSSCAAEAGQLSKPPATMKSRMCHTITRLSDTDCLLVGGRTSPDMPLADCWLRRLNQWQRVEDLPIPRYRHCATSIKTVEGGSAVLVFGGKGPAGGVLSDWLLWEYNKGWRQLLIEGDRSLPAFGAAMICFSAVEGVLVGGMTQDGIVRSACSKWELKRPTFDTICCQNLPLYGGEGQQISGSVFDRFGASLVSSSNRILLVGGIGRRHVLKAEEEIMAITLEPQPRMFPSNISLAGLEPRPILIGCVVMSYGSDFYILGGGAICFSFGSYINKGVWTVQDSRYSDERPLCLVADNGGSSAATHPPSTQLAAGKAVDLGHGPVATVTPRFSITSAQHFQEILVAGRPAILEGLEIGSCTQTWSLNYLKHRIGVDRQVVVHSATTPHMNFQTKNFAYDTMNFGDFLDLAANGTQLYLRSLASDKPSEKPAILSHDFPSIAEDFHLPPQLRHVIENAHSSPLRISGPVSMWLHYDVMSNVLCQIRGNKRLILYPPSDILHLGVSPGASSSSIDIFEATEASHPVLATTHPQEALLKPGDILFIPALWLHAASPTNGLSVAVNVFFRTLESGYAPGRDVYGNRDLQAYESGRRDINKILRAFDGLPSEATRFYLSRLAEELNQKAKEYE